MIVEKPHWAFRTVNDYPCGKFIICMTYVLYTSSCILVKEKCLFSKCCNSHVHKYVIVLMSPAWTREFSPGTPASSHPNDPSR